MSFYTICSGDHCQRETYTSEEILSILEQAIAAQSLQGIDPSLSPIVALVRETKSNVDLSFWLGTEAEYNALLPDPAAGLVMARVDASGKLYLCTDDTTLEDWRTSVLNTANNNAESIMAAAAETLNDSKQDQHLQRTAILTVAGWDSNLQSVSVLGVTTANTIIVAPDPDDQGNFVAANIKCTAQAADTLTFTCENIPAASIIINVVILGV